MHKNQSQLQQYVQQKPLTSLGGAVLLGFAFGSGVAMPVLLGAGLSRSGLGGTLKGWLRQEAELALREWLKKQQAPGRASEDAPGPEVEGHGHSDSGEPGQTPLARKVREELDGYGSTGGRVSESVQGVPPTH